jgi:threonine aldolase
MRFLAAPWVGLLQDGAWLRRAAQANAMAKLLCESIQKLPGVNIMFPRQANSVFVQMPEAASAGLRNLGWRFYTFIGKGGCRLMCSWDTTEEDVKQFVSDLKEQLAHP